MDADTEQHQPSQDRPRRPPSAAFVARVLETLLGSVPGADKSPETREADRAFILELFESLDPQTASEAQLAAVAIAASLSAMDGFVRAARSGISDETALRLRGHALAAGRSYAATERRLAKRPDRPAPARHARAAAQAEPDQTPTAVPEVPPGFIALSPGAKPIPAVSLFQPRDRHGRPIPHHRTDLMTRAQVLAALSLPRNPELDAAAIAEEEAMIAEQAALDAKTETPPPAGP